MNERPPQSKRGQLFSLDLMASGLGFIIFFIFLISVWLVLSSRLEEKREAEELQLQAFQITNMLIMSPGVPADWEENPAEVTIPGLQQSPGRLNQSKLDAFVALDYNQVQKTFNIGRFEYQFKVIGINGSLLYSAGIPPDNSSTRSISVNRWVLQENETQQILFTLWSRSK